MVENQAELHAALDAPWDKWSIFLHPLQREVVVRGRSTMLKVNYRTSHQIREAADRLLPAVVRDLDGREEARRGTISVFEGPIPKVASYLSQEEERERVAEFLREAIAGGVQPREVGVFVRSRAQLPRARCAVEAAALRPAERLEEL